MPVWIAIGGVVVGAIIGGGDSHSDYSDYSNYNDYSNYSDYAERRRVRLEAARNEYESARNQLQNIKTNQLDPILREVNSQFAQKSASDTTPDSLDSSVMQKITNQSSREISQQTGELNKEITEIETAIRDLEQLRNNLKQKYGNNENGD